MRSAASGLALASLLSGCAADLWDRRVYSCEDVESIEIDASLMEVDGSDGDDDCFVEVQNLRNHSFDDGILSGSELVVYASGQVLYDVEDTRLLHASEGLTIDGPRGRYRWLPDDEQLDATNVDDSGDTLFIEGPIRRVVLENGGDVDMAPERGFQVLEGDARQLEFRTKASFDRISIDLDDDADLVLPRGEVYGMNLTADDIEVDLSIRTVEIDPSALVVLSAGGAIDIAGGPGGTYVWPEPETPGLAAFCDPVAGHVDLLVENSVGGQFAWLDIVNTSRWPQEDRFETHRLLPTSPEEWTLQPGNTGFVHRALLGNGAGTSTGFSCGPDQDYREDPLGSQMSYVIRIEDDQERVVSCYATGHDMEGMLAGAYGPSEHNEDSVTPNACYLAPWATR